LTAVARAPLADAATTPLERVQAAVAREMGEVNRLILERLQSEVPLIPELARHLIAAGGKRVRPMLTVLATQLCGYSGSRHIGLAACVEFIHTATLLHDDVVDDSDLRRGRSTANAVWGNKAPVLVGDFLFSRAFQLMVADGNLRILEILSDASAVIAEGEVAQLVIQNDTSTAEQAYLHVIASKTAALFRAAAQIGPVIAGRPEAEERAMATYGQSLGVAFQLVDDALDYGAGDGALDKNVGDDFREGKVTLPVILAFARGSEEERAFWRRTIEQVEQTPEDLDRAIALMRRHGTLEETFARARAEGQRARDQLRLFPPSPARDALDDLVELCIERAR